MVLMAQSKQEYTEHQFNSLRGQVDALVKQLNTQDKKIQLLNNHASMMRKECDLLHKEVSNAKLNLEG